MNWSISRNGAEIGEWSEEDVRAFLQRGALLGSDLYWKEGMLEWKPLAEFVKPPIPSSVIPAQSSREIHLSEEKFDHPGIGRLQFLGLFLACIPAFYIFGYIVGLVLPLTLGGYIIQILGLSAVGALVAYRLMNVGYTQRYWILFTALAFVPILGLVILYICLFKAPGSEK